MLIHTRINHS